MIQKHLAVKQSNIRADHASQREHDDVTRKQLCRKNVLPHPIATDGRVQGQAGLQGVQSRLSAALLEKAQCGVEEQQRADKGGLDILPEDKLQHDCRFQHPGYRRPEFVQRREKRPCRDLRHTVGAVFLEPALRLVTGEAGKGRDPRWLPQASEVPSSGRVDLSAFPNCALAHT